MQWLFILMSLVMTMLPPVDHAAAREGRSCVTMEDGKAYTLADMAPLTPSIPEQPGRAQGPSIFYQDTFTVTVKAGQRVLLVGLEPGGGFATDDLLRLEALPAQKERSWDFRSADRMRIIQVKRPVDITSLLLPGDNTVTLTMQDLLGPVFSSSAYGLLFFDPCVAPKPMAMTATPAVTPLPTATALPVAAPTMVEVMQPTRQIAATRQAAATAAPAATPTPLADKPDATMPIMMNNRQFWTRLLGLLPLIIGPMLWWLMSRKRAPQRPLPPKRQG